jgi:hypothetical protein
MNVITYLKTLLNGAFTKKQKSVFIVTYCEGYELDKQFAYDNEADASAKQLALQENLMGEVFTNR